MVFLSSCWFACNALASRNKLDVPVVIDDADIRHMQKIIDARETKLSTIPSIPFPLEDHIEGFTMDRLEDDDVKYSIAETYQKLEEHIDNRKKGDEWMHVRGLGSTYDDDNEFKHLALAQLTSESKSKLELDWGRLQMMCMEMRDAEELFCDQVNVVTRTQPNAAVKMSNASCDWFTYGYGAPILVDGSINQSVA